MKSYNKSNFHKHTYCEFEMINNDFLKDKRIHYKSKFGSCYFYTEKGVYRYSNHWGRVANCRWKIKGIEEYKNQVYYVGFARWVEFFPLNNFEKEFYLDVDFSTGETIIYRITETETNPRFLMTLDLAFKRLKQIKTLFKDYKWALYYNESIGIVRTALIQKLINTDKPLQELKQSLKNDYP